MILIKIMFRCIVFTIVFGIISACSEQNDLKDTNVGTSESDVDSTGGDSGDSGSTSGVFVISAISGSTTEAGGTATFTVNLKSQPSANVSIAISSSDTTEGTVSPSSILFSSSNWSTAQTVTVTGVDDTAVDGNQGYTIILGVASSADSNYSGLDPADVSVSNTDDDTAGITIYSPGDNTTESGGSFTFTAKLNSQPSSDVTFSVSSSDTSEGSASQSSLTFTSSNWGTEQYVQISGVDDSLDDGNQNYTVTIGATSSSDSNYYGIDPDDLSVTNIDDDTAGFTVTTISGVTTEYGTTATFTVKLSSQPTANVTIAVSSSNTAEGTVSPSSLTFTSSNWSTAQTVTATGVNDGSADGNQNYNIVLGAATSSDSNFISINPADVAVTNTDDDTAGFTISSISDNTTELGDNATFTVLLNSQPSANVTVGVSSSDTGEGTVSPSSLTFTNSNWSTAQTVTVIGVDDNTTDGNQSYTIVLAAASSSDSNYNNLNPSDVSLSNLDDEWGGAKQTGSSKADHPAGIAVDSKSNIYVTGRTLGNMDGNSNPSSTIYDLFLLKYSFQGSLQWLKQVGDDSTFEESNGVAIDSSDNVYITGSTSIGLNGIPYIGGYDVFLVKYNSAGVIQWTKLMGGTESEVGYDVAIDSSGNAYVTGYTSGTLDGTSAGNSDIFLVKYNTSGDKQWTRQLGTSYHDYGYGVAVDSSGNAFVTGTTVRGLVEGTSTVNNTPDFFLVKYNSSGTKQWTQQFGDSAWNGGNDVTTDSSGNAYVTGYTAGTIDGNTNQGGNDMFLMKYNSSGTRQWSKMLGSSGSDYGNGVALDSSNNVYVTGVVDGVLDGNTSAGEDDIFLVKYNSSGTKQWARQHGTSQNDYGRKIAIDAKGYIYLLADGYGGIDDNTNSGSSDIYLLKYNSSGVKQ